ncbi:MAG: class I adenylate-forming enzyme family protein, partial [Desulfatitalea sp.]
YQAHHYPISTHAAAAYRSGSRDKLSKRRKENHHVICVYRFTIIKQRDRPMLIHHFLENSAIRYPDKIAVLHDSHRVTYQHINQKATSLAQHLHANGIVKGDRIALLIENNIDYVIAYYAILKTGAVAAPLNPGLKADGLQQLLNDLEPAAILCNQKSERLLKSVDLTNATLKLLIIRSPKQKWNGCPYTVSTFEEGLIATGEPSVVPEITPNDLASIIYTSGSTGTPKGVMLSHRNIVSNTHSICQYLSLTEADIQMVVLPFFYVMGKSLLNTHIAAGATVVINNKFLYPADVVNQMIDEQVTGFSGVPSTYAYLLNRSPLASCREKLSALRYCSQAGGHMAASLKRALRKALPDHTQIYIMYGATEASARLTYLDPEFIESKIDSIGKPIANVSIRILDDQGREVPDGSEGELVAAGPNIMQGYWKDPQDTARILDEQGYHTGDIGYRGSDGFLYLLRRKDSLLKVGGHRINPVEIEDLLMTTDLIIECVVVGVPDTMLGHKMIALVVPKENGLESKTLLEKCAVELPNHKRPSGIMIIRALPKNASGKIEREKCIEIASSAE